MDNNSDNTAKLLIFCVFQGLNLVYSSRFSFVTCCVSKEIIRSRRKIYGHLVDICFYTSFSPSNLSGEILYIWLSFGLQISSLKALQEGLVEIISACLRRANNKFTTSELDDVRTKRKYFTDKVQTWTLGTENVISASASFMSDGSNLGKVLLSVLYISASTSYASTRSMSIFTFKLNSSGIYCYRRPLYFTELDS